MLAMVRTHCGGRAATLADKIERSPSYVSRMLYAEGKRGKKRIGEDMADLITSALGLEKGRLDDEAAALAEQEGAIAEASAEYESATADDEVSLARSGATLAVSGALKPVVVTDDQDVAIPLVELRLSAGVAGFEVTQDGDGAIGAVKLDRRFVESKHYDPSKLYALRVRGESMEPKLSAGDTVIIDTADIRPVDGGVFAVNYEGEAVIKRMSRDAGDWWLTSDNPDQRRYHRKICRGGDCIIIGRAIQAMTSL